MANKSNNKEITVDGDKITVAVPSKLAKTFGDHVIRRDAGTNLLVIPGYVNADPFLVELVRGTDDRGFAPVRDSDLSAVITRRQAMAENWEIYVTGRASPVDRFKEIAAMANDGQGSGAFSSDMVGALDVVNRGAFMAYMPIDTLAWDDWDKFGLHAIPLEKKEGKKTNFILEVDVNKVRRNFGLWALDPLDCFPTGDPRWPYWFEKEGNWVLIPSELGDQVIQRVGPPSKKYPGWGQSGTWRYVGTFVIDQMVREMEVESLLNEPPRGFVWLKGADYPGQLEEVLIEHKKSIEEGDSLHYSGRVFGESISSDADLLVRPWTEAPSGYDPRQWRTFREDSLAAAFHMSVSFLRTRVGVGSFVQSGITNEIQAETGIAWMKSVLENIYNKIVPRVTVSVVVPSDRAQKSKYERFKLLSESIKNVQASTDGEGLTTEEVRTMIQEMGIEITPANPDTKTRRADNRENQDD